MKRMLLWVCLTILTIASVRAGEPDSTKHTIEQKFIGNIFTGFYYSFSDSIKPKQAFELSTALFGYIAEIDKKVKATLIYDVTRTTGDIAVMDTVDHAYNSVLYFKGSDYTAFLKQASIDWKINSKFEFSVGQLLNQQYLTVQDKFWGLRYIAPTSQERNKMGYQADFGARITWSPLEKLKLTVGAVNGNGPFYRQDNYGVMEYAANLELIPYKGFLFKVYTDYSEYNDIQKQVLSLFASWKGEKARAGVEYNYVQNYQFTNENKAAISLYGAFKIKPKLELLARYDLIRNAFNEYDYIIAGIQYEPVKNYFLSLNCRDYVERTEPLANGPYQKIQLYFNAGIKF